MFFRAMTLAVGIAGGTAFSQFPEYSQQYTQRLAGAVDELSAIVAMFDADAKAVGLSRDAALDQMAGAGGMAAARAKSMRYVFGRYDRLSNDLNSLREHPQVWRAAQIWRMTDLDVARKAWGDFRPALPVTADGIGYGAAGFLAGLGLMGGIGALCRGLWRRRNRAA